MNCKFCEEPVRSRGMCRSHYEKALIDNNKEYKERQRAQSAEWRKKNPDRCKEIAINRTKDPRCRARDKVTKRNHILKRRGLTPETNNSLLEHQNNTCPICERSLENNFKHLDHDHITGVARGYLCSRCNNGLGMFLDSSKVLASAIKYLNNPPAQLFTFKIYDDTN